MENLYAYKIQASIEGIVPLLQHNFAKNNLETLLSSSKKRTGSTDYSLEWLETLYHDNHGYLAQPASHIEGAMVKAAARFNIPGQGKRSWKDPMKAYVYVMPDLIRHIWGNDFVPVPDADLNLNPTENLQVSVMRVVVGRAAVARHRLMLNAGWRLDFDIEVHDNQVRADVVETILKEAGRAIGIGDYRPRYGRFIVRDFQVIE